MLHYLNDFLVITLLRKKALQFSQDFFKLCMELKISINEKKSKKGLISRYWTWYNSYKACLPLEKLQKAKDLVAMALLFNSD